MLNMPNKGLFIVKKIPQFQFQNARKRYDCVIFSNVSKYCNVLKLKPRNHFNYKQAVIRVILKYKHGLIRKFLCERSSFL